MSKTKEQNIKPTPQFSTPARDEKKAESSNQKISDPSKDSGKKK